MAGQEILTAPNSARLLESNPALVTLRALDAVAHGRGTIVMGMPSARVERRVTRRIVT